MSLFTRTKHTGEPGNGGRFARRNRDEAPAGLLPAVQAPAGWGQLDADQKVDAVSNPYAPDSTLEFVAKNCARNDQLMRALAGNPAATAGQLDIAVASPAWDVRFAVAEHENTRPTTLTHIENDALAEREVQLENARGTRGMDANIHRRAAQSLEALAMAAATTRMRAVTV